MFFALFIFNYEKLSTDSKVDVLVHLVFDLEFIKISVDNIFLNKNDFSKDQLLSIW